MNGFSFEINGNSTSDVLPVGLYWLTYYHGGYFEQNILSVVIFTPFQEDDKNNKWIKCAKIIPELNWDSITLEYNPYLRQIRNPSPHSREIRLRLIDSNYIK